MTDQIVQRWRDAEGSEEVLAQQSLCYPLPAELIDREVANDGYSDSPGIVWQGARVSDSANEDS